MLSYLSVFPISMNKLHEGRRLCTRLYVYCVYICETIVHCTHIFGVAIDTDIVPNLFLQGYRSSMYYNVCDR